MDNELKIGVLTFYSYRYDELITLGLVTKNDFWVCWDGGDIVQEIEKEEAIALIELLKNHFDL